MTPAFAQDSFQLAQINISNDLGLSDVAQKSQAGGANLQTKIGSDSIPEIIGSIIGFLLAFLGSIFFVLTLYAGFLWMLAHGNDEYTKKAKDILTAAIIGLIIVLGSYAIVTFVFSSVDSTVNNPPPNATSSPANNQGAGGNPAAQCDQPAYRVCLGNCNFIDCSGGACDGNVQPQNLDQACVRSCAQQTSCQMLL